MCTQLKFHAQIILLAGKLSDVPTFESPSCLLAFTRPRAVERRVFNTSLFTMKPDNRRPMCTRQGKLAAKVENEKRETKSHVLTFFFSLLIQLYNSHIKIIKSSAYVMRFRACEKRDVQTLVISSASPRWMSTTRPKAVARMVSMVNN